VGSSHFYTLQTGKGEIMNKLVSITFIIALAFCLSFISIYESSAETTCKMPDGNEIIDGDCGCEVSRSSIKCYCCYSGEVKEVEPEKTPEGKPLPVPDRDKDGNPILK